VVDIIAAEYPEEAPVWLSEALIEMRESETRGRILGHLERFGDRRALPGLIVALGMPPCQVKTTPKLEDSLGGATQLMAKQRVGMPPPDTRKHAHASVGMAPGTAPGTAETAVARGTVGGVIVKIAGDRLANVLASYLFVKGDDTLRVRNAALLSLVRIRGKDKVRQILSGGAGGGDVFLEPLRFWAEHFAFVPGTKSEVLMCQMQWLRLTAEQKETLQQRVQSLQEREGYSFQIVDSHILLEAEKTFLAKPVDMLRSAIGERLRAVAHTKRPSSYRGAADDYREDFPGQCKSLRYTDLLRIRLLLHALESETFVGQLRQYLQEDFADVETEVGGLSFLKAGTIEFRAYPPAKRLGDNQYHESAEMIADGVYCLARWHCHADPHQEQTDQADWVESQYNLKHSNKTSLFGPRNEILRFAQNDNAFYGGVWKGAALAGPGVDDIGYVKYFCCPLLVVTYIDRDTFNIDYVSAEGIVIDLGNYLTSGQWSVVSGQQIVVSCEL